MGGDCVFSSLGWHEKMEGGIIYFSQNNESMTLLNLIYLSIQMLCIPSSFRSHPTHCAKAKVGNGAPTGRKTYQGHADKYSDIIFGMETPEYE